MHDLTVAVSPSLFKLKSASHLFQTSDDCPSPYKMARVHGDGDDDEEEDDSGDFRPSGNGETVEVIIPRSPKEEKADDYRSNEQN